MDIKDRDNPLIKEVSDYLQNVGVKVIVPKPQEMYKFLRKEANPETLQYQPKDYLFSTTSMNDALFNEEITRIRVGYYPYDSVGLEYSLHSSIFISRTEQNSPEHGFWSDEERDVVWNTLQRAGFSQVESGGFDLGGVQAEFSLGPSSHSALGQHIRTVIDSAPPGSELRADHLRWALRKSGQTTNEIITVDVPGTNFLSLNDQDSFVRNMQLYAKFYGQFLRALYLAKGVSKPDLTIEFLEF